MNQTRSALEIDLNGPWLLDNPSSQHTPITWSAQRTGVVLRDDLLHPWVSGNKLRKLDGLFARWIAQGVTDIVTCGGVQSAHCTAVASLARTHHMTAHCLIRGEVTAHPTGNLAMSMLYGRVYPQSRDVYADRDAMFASFLEQHDLPARTTALLPEGAMCRGGMLGFIRLVGMLKAHLPKHTALVIDAGTGTSAIALALGIAYHQLDWHVEAVCLLKDQAQSLAAAANALAQEHFLAICDHTALPITWYERVTPRRFGKFYQQDMQHCIDVARETGIVLDPIYTLGAWQHCVTRAPTRSDATCMIHTGGGLNILGAIQRKPAWFKELSMT